MTVIVRDLNSGKETIYDYVIDALRDIVDEDLVEEQLNEIYPQVDVEGIKFSVGTIYRRCGGENFWEACVEDYIQWEAEYIEDELTTSGEIDYWGFKLINPDFKEED